MIISMVYEENWVRILILTPSLMQVAASCYGDVSVGKVTEDCLEIQKFKTWVQFLFLYLSKWVDSLKEEPK